MLIDLAAIASTETLPLDADICIIGAGPAGISSAGRLCGHGLSILLLESGGADYESSTAQLNAGENIGMPYYDLEDARLRLFGGTAAIWGGRCTELDDIDFEPRHWVRYSGWPFSKATLTPYYDDAWSLLGLREAGRTAPQWNAFGVNPPTFGRGVLTTEFWRFDNHWDRFGLWANRGLVEHPDVTVLLHATATNFKLSHSGARIESLEVRHRSGFHRTVRAEQFVLAAGGIENPRLLLASRDQATEGIGNQYDAVGRYFMEHPHARAGRLNVDALWQTLRTFRSSHRSRKHRYAACLRPQNAFQEQHQILNSSFTPRVRPHVDGRLTVGSRIYRSIKDRALPTEDVRKVWRSTRAAQRILKQSLYPLKPWWRVKSGQCGIYLSTRAEQAPNPESRVKLSDDRDDLGMPRVELNWRFSELDKRTLQILVQELDTQMRRDGVGSVEPAAWLAASDLPWEHDSLMGHHPIGGYHHMGTTRMSTNPRFGVVDANCKVHGVSNLHIAGSSVFPTSGWANPTLTILALSLRLGDHLLHIMSRPSGNSLATQPERSAEAEAG